MTASVVFGKFLRSVTKLAISVGGGRGTVSVPLIFFSFLLELIRHSDLAFQKQHKGTSVTSPKYKIFLVMKFLLKVP